MTARYTDAFQAVGLGLGLTGPHWGNLEYSPFSPAVNALLPAYMRLDYVFHDGHFRSISAQVWPDYGGSDHEPLVVELAWAS